MKDIYLAGGCFWGVEEYFSRIPGVVDTTVGYANGTLSNPSYEDVKKGSTGHAETVKVSYDETKVNLDEILDKYWAIVEPTVKDRQGPDVGTQYRTGLYFVDGEDEVVIRESVKREQEKHTESIVTEVEPLRDFFDAEEYHQDYLKKNPGGYCHIPLN